MVTPEAIVLTCPELPYYAMASSRRQRIAASALGVGWKQAAADLPAADRTQHATDQMTSKFDIIPWSSCSSLWQ